MTPTPRTQLLMVTLATGLLAVGAIATSVAADGQSNSSSTSAGPAAQGPHSNQTADGREDHKDAQQADMREKCAHPANATVQKACDDYKGKMRQQQEKNQDIRQQCAHPANATVAKQCEDYKEKMRQQQAQQRKDTRELRDRVQDTCKEAKTNATAKQVCDHLKDAVKARRVAAALMTAIRVHEQELGRVDFRIDMLNERLASGNLTANQTAAAHDSLAKLQARHTALVQKIKDEQAKLASLRDRWTEVRDHMKDRQDKGQDDGGVDANATGSASSESPSASASASGSATAAA
jgi:predicted  nucleic acid-binding Zn-ribbon protein